MYVFDVNSIACEKFKQELSSFGDIQIVASAKSVADESVAVVSILPSAAIVSDTFLNQSSGVIAAKQNPDRILLECSTIDSASTQRIGQEVMKAESGTYVDSPVSVSVAPYSHLLGELVIDT